MFEYSLYPTILAKFSCNPRVPVTLVRSLWASNLLTLPVTICCMRPHFIPSGYPPQNFPPMMGGMHTDFHFVKDVQSIVVFLAITRSIFKGSKDQRIKGSNAAGGGGQRIKGSNAAGGGGQWIKGSNAAGGGGQRIKRRRRRRRPKDQTPPEAADKGSITAGGGGQRIKTPPEAVSKGSNTTGGCGIKGSTVMAASRPTNRSLNSTDRTFDPLNYSLFNL